MLKLLLNLEIVLKTKNLSTTHKVNLIGLFLNYIEIIYLPLDPILCNLESVFNITNVHEEFNRN